MRGRAVGALIGLSGGTFLYTTAEALPVGLLLTMATDLTVSPAQVGLLVTAYGAVVVVASVPLTALARRIPVAHSCRRCWPGSSSARRSPRSPAASCSCWRPGW